ncbi:MAG: hypothetical protein RI924_1274 [Bacteroidota bacterium]|jgi:hypothetical protein
MEISKNSRIWIYQSDRELTEQELKAIQSHLDGFTANWAAHGNSLHAKGEIRFQRFIIMAVDEQKTGASGCSIDKSVALMKQFETQFGIQLFDRMQIAYRDGNAIKTFKKAEFNTLVEKGILNEHTLIFNNLIQHYAELDTAWEIPLKETWLSRLMPA